MSYAQPASEHGKPMCAFCRREPSEVVDLIEGGWLNQTHESEDFAACQTCIGEIEADETLEKCLGDHGDCAVCGVSREGRDSGYLGFTGSGVAVTAATCDDCRERALRVRIENTRPPMWLTGLPGDGDGDGDGDDRAGLGDFIDDDEELGDGGDELEVGDRVIDRDDDSPSAAEVVDVPGTTADEHEISGMDKTVAAFNPDYPADDPVVGVQFVQNGEPSGTTYHYPASRLEQVGEEWEPEPSKTPAQREREQLIEEHRDAFEGFRHAVIELAERPDRSANYFLERYKKNMRPTTRGECRHSREDDYRPDDPDAIVCWECNGGGRQPNKLQADDDVPPDAPCAVEGFPNPKRALKDWFYTMLVEGNASPSTPHPADVERSLEPNPDFSRLHWAAKDLTDDEDNFRRSATVRIGYEATLGGLLDEDYNHGRACAFLRDLGVDTNELLPGGDPYVGD